MVFHVPISTLEMAPDLNPGLYSPPGHVLESLSSPLLLFRR